MCLPKAATDVEGGDVSGPDADHEEEDEGGAVLLLPEERDEGEGVGDVDEAEEALGGVGKDLVEGRRGSRSRRRGSRVRALRTGSWASTGKLGRVTTKARAVPRAIHQMGMRSLAPWASAPTAASLRYS